MTSRRDQLLVLGFRHGSRLVTRLPDRAARTVGTLLGTVMWAVSPGRRHTVERHQRRVASNTLDGRALRAQVRQTFCSYGRMFIDSFRLSGLTPARVDARMSVEGIEHVEAALAKGNGLIMAMPHLGCWDFGGAWFAPRYGLTVIAEVLEPPELFEWFVGHRTRLGIEVVPLGPDAFGPLLAALRANRPLGLLCDRDIAGGGIEVEFLGVRTTMPAGPATLSLRTGAPILPNAAVYEADGRIRGIVRPPIEFERKGKLREDVAALTQKVADALGELIREHPEQWHVLQPFWPDDPGYRQPR